eukprot:71724_1
MYFRTNSETYSYIQDIRSIDNENIWNNGMNVETYYIFNRTTDHAEQIAQLYYLNLDGIVYVAAGAFIRYQEEHVHTTTNFPSALSTAPPTVYINGSAVYKFDNITLSVFTPDNLDGLWAIQRDSPPSVSTNSFVVALSGRVDWAHSDVTMGSIDRSVHLGKSSGHIGFLDPYFCPHQVILDFLNHIGVQDMIHYLLLRMIKV